MWVPYRWRRRWVLCIVTCFPLLWLGRELGFWDHLLYETSYANFAWPLVDADIPTLVREVRSGKPPSTPPLNDWDFAFLRRPPALECPVQDASLPRFHILVKSAVDNFLNRANIRATWAGQRVSTVRGFELSITFVLGKSQAATAMAAVGREAEAHKDLLVVDLIDSYRNNSRKMLAAFSALTSCHYEAALLVDDDYLVIPERVLEMWSEAAVEKVGGLGDNYYAGWRIHSAPFRNRWHKHYVPLSVYPYNAYPPYITAGAYLMSSDTVQNVLAATAWLQHYAFDDVFLGIVAYRTGLRLTHTHAFPSFQEGWLSTFLPLDWSSVAAVHGITGIEALTDAMDHVGRVAEHVSPSGLVLRGGGARDHGHRGPH